MEANLTLFSSYFYTSPTSEFQSLTSIIFKSCFSSANYSFCKYPTAATCISRVRFLKKILMIWPWIFLFTFILSDVMVASSMLFAPLCVEWIYSKLFMGPPYFKEEKLRLVFDVHDKDQLNSTSLITQFANSPSGLSRGRASKCEQARISFRWNGLRPSRDQRNRHQ